MKMKMKTNSTCECGCNNEVVLGKRFLLGHNLRKLNKESLYKQQRDRKGRKAWNKDLETGSLSEEHKNNISDSLKGRKFTNKTKKKISKAKKDKPKTKEHCEALSKSLMGSNHSDKTKKKISNSMKGENHWNWKDGSSKQSYDRQFNKQLKEEIRKRDNHTCQECEITEKKLKNKRFKKLDIHHIDYNKKNNKKKNLISLCHSCHMKTNFDREVWKRYFKKKIKGIET